MEIPPNLEAGFSSFKKLQKNEDTNSNHHMLKTQGLLRDLCKTHLFFDFIHRSALDCACQPKLYYAKRFVEDTLAQAGAMCRND